MKEVELKWKLSALSTVFDIKKYLKYGKYSGGNLNVLRAVIPDLPEYAFLIKTDEMSSDPFGKDKNYTDYLVSKNLKESEAYKE